MTDEAKRHAAFSEAMIKHIEAFYFAALDEANAAGVRIKTMGTFILLPQAFRGSVHGCGCPECVARVATGVLNLVTDDSANNGDGASAGHPFH